MGVLITKGSRISIPEGGLVIRAGGLSTLTIHVSYDMYPHWLRIGIDHALQCERHSTVVDEIWTDGSRPEEIEALEAELCSGMQAFVASAAAIDGFYATVKALAPLESGARRAGSSRTPRYAQIAETFRRTFGIGPKTFGRLRDQLQTIFRFRDEAIHPTADSREPVPHPRLGVATERRLAMYTASNSVNAATSALAVIGGLLGYAKPEFPKLVEHCQAAKPSIYPLGDEWAARGLVLFNKT